MKRKSLNLGGNRSPEDMDKVINKLNSNIGAEELNSSKAGDDESDKQRVTHYLSTKILADLEEVYEEIRRRLPFNEKAKVKKSHIVDLALEMIVEDYRKKGDKSLLSGKFIK